MSLIGIGLRFAAASAGANVAGQLVNKSMAPNHQQPVWHYENGGTYLVLMQNRRTGHTETYELHAIENGHDRTVGWYPTYPESMARCQEWISYLANGGTLLSWCQIYALNGAAHG